MSKSKGNVVSPDKYIEEYGSDVFRLYLMFGFSVIRMAGPWNDDGIKSIAKFADRIERLVRKAAETENNNIEANTAAEKELNYIRNYAAKNITRDLEAFSFNTSVARLMEYLNALQKYEALGAERNIKFFKACVDDFLRLLAPFAPHFTEELWEITGHKNSVFDEAYPSRRKRSRQGRNRNTAIQINSKTARK